MLLNTVNRIASTAKSRPFQNVNSVSMRAPTLSHHIIYSLLWLRGCLSSWLKCFFLLSHLPLLPSLPASSFHSSYISAQATIYCFMTPSFSSVAKLCLTLLQPHDLGLTRLLCPWDFPGKNTGGLPFPSPGDSSWPRDRFPVSCIGRWILYHWTTWEARLL